MNLNVVIGEGANIPARPQEIMRNIFSQADASLIYIFRGILFALGGILIFSAISSIIYFINIYTTNANVNNTSNSGDSLDISTTLKYLWNFLQSNEGRFYILLFLALKALMSFVRRIDQTEAREFVASVMLCLVLSIIAIAFGSKNIKNFATNTAEMAKNTIQGYLGREPRAENFGRQDWSRREIFDANV